MDREQPSGNVRAIQQAPTNAVLERQLQRIYLMQQLTTAVEWPITAAERTLLKGALRAVTEAFAREAVASSS